MPTTFQGFLAIIWEHPFQTAIVLIGICSVLRWCYEIFTDK